MHEQWITLWLQVSSIDERLPAGGLGRLCNELLKLSL
jgi:hypothetical protein